MALWWVLIVCSFTGVLEQVLTGGLTLLEYTQNLQCPGAGLPIFSGQLIRSAGFLGPLSAESCRSLGVVDTNRYLVGAVSTSFSGWEDAVGTQGAGTISAAIKILDSVSPQVQRSLTHWPLRQHDDLFLPVRASRNSRVGVLRIASAARAAQSQAHLRRVPGARSVQLRLPSGLPGWVTGGRLGV